MGTKKKNTEATAGTESAPVATRAPRTPKALNPAAQAMLDEAKNDAKSAELPE